MDFSYSESLCRPMVICVEKKRSRPRSLYTSRDGNAWRIRERRHRESHCQMLRAPRTRSYKCESESLRSWRVPLQDAERPPHIAASADSREFLPGTRESPPSATKQLHRKRNSKRALFVPRCNGQL